MNEAAYKAILTTVNESGANGKRGLVGASPSLMDFIAVLQAFPEGIARVPGGESFCLILGRPAGSDPLDRSILATLCPERRVDVVDLRPLSEFCNHGRLFGIADRVGCFESAAEAFVAIRGVEYLSGAGRRRLCQYIEAWGKVRNGLRVVLLAEVDFDVRELIDQLRSFSRAEYASLDGLRRRIEDIPFLVHDEARAHGLRLADFSPDAIEVFLRDQWPGDISELSFVVRELCGQLRERNAQIDSVQVESAINRVREVSNRRASSRSAPEPNGLWLQLADLIADCNRRTNALIGVPFFGINERSVHTNPLAAIVPELRWNRLVSWCYVMFIESGDPNLRIVLSLMSGRGLSDDIVRSMRDHLVVLRTYGQHRLEYGSAHDDRTAQVTYKWFEDACGKPQPEEEDFERCVLQLLHDVVRATKVLLEFLKLVNEDEYRKLTLNQWQDGRERSWQKHRYATLVHSVIGMIGRDDLDGDAVTNALLSELQQLVAVVAADRDKEATVRSAIEERIGERFPRKMPVNGKDIIALGVPPSPMIEEILKRLRTHFDHDGAGRDELLSLAQQIIDEMTVPRNLEIGGNPQ